MKEKWHPFYISLRSLINRWELMPGSLPDEFDQLNFRLISVLKRNPFDEASVFAVLDSVLKETYGIVLPEDTLHGLVSELRKLKEDHGIT